MKTATKVETKKLDYKKLLSDALTLEGSLSQGFRMFWNYSWGNQIEAMIQLKEPMPINTYKGWQTLGRQVKKGEKAISLWMPVTIKVKDEDDETKDRQFTKFIYVARWFGLNQTDGDDYELPEAIGFDKDKVLANLQIEEVPFSHTNGNVQGYASRRTLAINPVASEPLETLWHELAHIVLGHTEDTCKLDRSTREAEAESVAYLLANVFDYGKLGEMRGYIQNWLREDTLTEESSKRIVKAMNAILQANQA